MDEPSATLTDQELEHLFAVIDDLRRKGVGIVYISHRLEEIARICDRVTVLRDGRWIGTGDVHHYDRARIVRDMVGRELSEEFPERSVDLGEEILRLDGLTRGRRYRDVSLSLHRGEILGLAGLVGSGRSDLAMGLVGSPAPDAGQVFVRGRAVRVRGPRHALELGIGLLTEDRKQLGIIPMRSVLENMCLSASAAAGHRLGILDRAGERTRAEELQRALGVRAADLGQPIVSLSGGNQQKALLGRVLATGAEILVFDEPTRGIDVAAKAEIYGLLNELVRTGKAVLMISSELPELIGMCDRIAVMHEGFLRGVLDRARFDPERIMELATGSGVAP